MKLCNFKSTTTNDYIRQTASFLGRALLLLAMCPLHPLFGSSLRPVYLSIPTGRANRSLDGTAAFPGAWSAMTR